MTGPQDHSRYYVEVEAEDSRLTARLDAIRAREDAHTITVRQAADERIAALTAHLEAVRELRERHFGGDK